MHERYEKALAGLEGRGRLRRLSPRHGVDFSSNDYLALAGAPAMRRAVMAALARGLGVGSGGSRLLRGNDPEHEALESEAASFFGAGRALYMGSGYVANFALLSTLPQRGDLVVYDALVHASCHEGMRAGRAAYVEAAHNDCSAVEDAISSWRKGGGDGKAWIAVESLYSMDGDSAPLADLIAIADRHDAYLIVDEAHATGVFGPEGRGLASAFEGRDNVICLHTCGKALGAHGALICAPAVLCDFLVNRARAFIYATAPSPLMAAAVREALALLKREPERRQALQNLVALAGRELAARCDLKASGSQIIPVLLGGDQRTMAVAARLQVRGLDIRGIRPPSVPEGTARLRIAITLNADETQVTAMAEALAEELAGAGP